MKKTIGKPVEFKFILLYSTITRNADQNIRFQARLNNIIR